MPIRAQDVGTSKETAWDDLEAFGRRFCKFLEQAIHAQAAREAQKRKQAAEADNTQPNPQDAMS